ncbi:oxidoreductase family protein [Athelia psychrophila]|uniref:Oxidoreductase family protein n=1 Tax=Athelia psychrophila TaxID=1759441 RepID=A0A166SUK7_9AGAM|nr:oxidoreductase family protein [Fibularhizoctonia sp. CBS 109695]
MSPPVGIAVLGAGLFATLAHLPAIASLGRETPVLLKAVYSRSERSAQNLAATASELKLGKPAVYHDGDASANLDTLLGRSDISAVIVALPITQLPGVIIEALAAGKHVLSEKPVAPDVKTGAMLLATYNSQHKPKGLKWRVAENFEAEPGFRAAGKAIRDGKIGKVICFSSRVVDYIDKTSPCYLAPWRNIPDHQGGFVLDIGVHSAAVLRVILPSPITHISGFASLNKDYLAPHDTIHTIMRCADGSQGIFELSFAAPFPSLTQAGNGVTVTGTCGWLLVTQNQDVITTTIRSMTKVDGELESEKEEVIEEKNWRGVECELKSFLNVIAGEDDGLGNPLGALRDVAIIQAALNSQGKLVDLDKLISQ